MVNYLKWGLIGALIVGIVIFRDQIKGALSSAGTTLGEGIGGAASGFLSGAVRETVAPLTRDWGTEKGRENLPSGFPSIWELFGGQTEQKAYGEMYQSNDMQNRDPSCDPAITPYNREYMASIEQAAAKSARIQPFAFQSVYRQVKQDYPNIPIASRLALVEKTVGAPSPLQVFYQLKKAGLSQTEAIRKLRELGLSGR